MKNVLSRIALCALIGISSGLAQPAPATGFTPLEGGTTSTNISIASPNGLFLSTVVYSPVTALAKAHVFSWNFPVVGGSPDATVTGFELIHGDLYSVSSNKIALPKTTTQFAFANTLNTNQTYYFYVVSTNAAGQKSLPSNTVIYQPPPK